MPPHPSLVAYAPGMHASHRRKTKKALNASFSTVLNWEMGVGFEKKIGKINCKILQFLACIIRENIVCYTKCVSIPFSFRFFSEIRIWQFYFLHFSFRLIPQSTVANFRLLLSSDVGKEWSWVSEGRSPRSRTPRRRTLD